MFGRSSYAARRRTGVSTKWVGVCGIGVRLLEVLGDRRNVEGRRGRTCPVAGTPRTASSGAPPSGRPPPQQRAQQLHRCEPNRRAAGPTARCCSPHSTNRGWNWIGSRETRHGRAMELNRSRCRTMASNGPGDVSAPSHFARPQARVAVADSTLADVHLASVSTGQVGGHWIQPPTPHLRVHVRSGWREEQVIAERARREGVPNSDLKGAAYWWTTGRRDLTMHECGDCCRRRLARAHGLLQ